MPVFSVTKDGFYTLLLDIRGKDEFHAAVTIEMQGTHGYLSAVDWPLLPVSGISIHDLCKKNKKK